MKFLSVLHAGFSFRVPDLQEHYFKGGIWMEISGASQEEGGMKQKGEFELQNLNQEKGVFSCGVHGN